MRRLTGKFRAFATSSSSENGSRVHSGSTITTSSRQGFSYIGFGKFDSIGKEGNSVEKAINYLKEALTAHTSVKMSPEQTREAARYHHDIAMCHHRDGNLDKAIAEYKVSVMTLEDMLQTSPSDDVSVIPIIKRARYDLSCSLSGLGVALADQGSDSEALEIAQKALEIRKSLLGANHVSVAECLNTIGGLYFRQANYNKAADAYQESLRLLLTKTQGKEENKYVALAYFNIGIVYDKLNLKKGSDAVYKALLIAEHVWGSDHEQVDKIRSTWEQMQKK